MLIQNKLQEVSIMNRAELIQYLVTNGGEVPDALERVSDNGLRSMAAGLVKNAAGDFGRFDALGGTFKTSFDQAGGAGEKGEYYERGVKDVFLPPVKIDDPEGSSSYEVDGDDDNDDDDMDDWDEGDLEKGGSRGVKNSKKPETLNEWLKRTNAPPVVVNALREQQENDRKVRNKLIRRLVDNSSYTSPAARQQYANYLSKKDTPELKFLAQSMVVQNNNFPHGQVIPIQPYMESQPNYLGAAGGIVENYGGPSNNGLTKEDGPPLPAPTINWAEENKGTVEAIANAMNRR
jgi:hypothetical protein